MTHSTTKSLLKGALLLSTGFSTLALSSAAVAQDSAGDEIVVTGIRQVVQDTIKLKREATTVVDGLTADEIGDLPALSIAEALEQITSIGSQREGSGATEVSIRGLGPFLGSTVINGREATNGSGDRSVNFSQFPSELFNKIEVHKTQSAELIEGGVAGQISLSTLKPLDYGKRRIQLQAKGSLGADNIDLEDPERSVGYRLTGSYVDQWEGKFGEFGISVGGQLRQQTNPEQEARTGTPDACVIAANVGTPDEVGFDGSGCDATGFNAEGQDINPVTGLRFGVDNDVLLTSSSVSFRQNVTDDSRDSIFAAAQWKPNDRLEINADVQYADRVFEENRSDLVVDRNDIEEAGTGETLPVPGFGFTTTSTGAFRTATTSGEVQAISQFTERLEEYIGFGGNVSYDVNDRLNLSIDGSYSDTSRRENQVRARVATGTVIAGVEIFGEGSDAFRVTLDDTDVTDISQFTNNNVEVQEDLNQFRNHEIWAVKGDATYELGGSIFDTFKAGARYSVQSYDQLPRVRVENEFDDLSFFNGDFATEINGETVISTIELDTSGNDDEQGLSDALGFTDLFGFTTFVNNNNVLNNDTFEGVSGAVPGFTVFDEDSPDFGTFIPGSTATFVVDNNGDIDITATAEEFVRLGFLEDNDTDEVNESTNLGPLALEQCVTDSFQEPDFLDGEISGNLITNIDGDGNVIEAGTGREFLTFEANCLAGVLLNRPISVPSSGDASGAELVQSVDVEEETVAFYGQLDYNTQLDGLPLRGNVGLRVVDTTVTSDSFRTGLIAQVDDVTGNVTGLTADAENVERIRDTFSYTEFLPSINAVLDVNEDVLVRGGIYRALSRPDPADLGAGRTFNTLSAGEDDDIVTIDDLVGGVSSTGNPRREPFLSWNYDLGVEWYPNEDSILAVNTYYKAFNGGFQTELQEETFTINGEDITRLVPVIGTSDESNTIFGVEVTAAHAFTYLPGVLSGLGFNASYNYADSNFEIEDSEFGEAVTLDQNGDVLEVLEGFVAPANLPGLSRHTANGRVYWNVGKANFAAIGKYRSSFFQPFVDDGGDLRFIGGAFVLDGRFSYKLNDNIKLSVEGTNLLNTAREQFRTTTDNFGELNVFGPRYFVGITAKF